MPIVSAGGGAQSLTLKEVLSDLRIRIDDKLKKGYTDEYLRHLLNRGQEYIVGKTGCSEEYTTITTIADQQEYTFPTTIVGIIEAFYDDKRFYPKTFAELSETNPNWRDASSGTPQYWYYYGNVLGLYPAPDTADENVDIFYVKKPLEMLGDTSRSELPDQFNELIILYAEYRIQKQQRDPVMAVTWKELDDRIRELRASYRARGKGHARSMYPY